MYCNYTYIPGASAANIKDDLIKLVTANAVTDNAALLASLSASCDKTITTITRADGVASGWTTGIGDLALVSGLAIDEVSYTITMPDNLRWIDVAYTSGTYYLIGKAGVTAASTNIIYSTTDFKSFTSITLPYTAAWRRVIIYSNKIAIYAGGDESSSDNDNTFVYKALADLDDPTVSWTVSTLPITTAVKYFASSNIGGAHAILMSPVSSSTNYSYYNNAAAVVPHIFNSSNGISWTQLTGAALTAPSTTTPGIVGATPGVPLGDWYTDIAVATQYIGAAPLYNLTNLSAPIYMSFGGNNGIYTAGASNKIITSTNGSSWYQHNTPSSTGSSGTPLSSYWTGVTYGEGIFVAVQGGQGYAFTSGNLISKAYFTKVDGTGGMTDTNSGIQTWVATTLPSAFAQSCQITYHKGFFVILLGGDATKSSTMFVGKYSASTNTINWEEKSLDITGNWARAYTHPNLKELILLSGSRLSFTYKATEGLKVALSDANIYDSNIKAANTITGVNPTSKYANIAVAGGILTLRSAENLASSTITNLIYGSDSSAYAQLLDLDSGGVIFVSCSSSHIAFLAYRSASSEFGSRLGGFCGVFEYSRDDAWSISSTSASPYPTHCFFTSENKSKVHVARIKTSISSPDITDSAAVLNLSTGISLDKKILNSSGTGLAHIASDIRANNSTDFAYSVLGGILKGIKATTRLQGNTLEEAILDGVTYVIWEGGGVAAGESIKERYLIEKA